MTWLARLDLQYRRDSDGRCVCRFEHSGPLRVLQPLYPEGQGICHQVIIHPPGGIVGGDRLAVDLALGERSHALITTPGATRFYRCDKGLHAAQLVTARVGDAARLEWVPAENIAYSACDARNSLRLDLAPTAQALVWDILALGLPAAQAPFVKGRFEQHLALGDAWIERGQIDARDTRLLASPLGLAGRTCVASLAFLSGSPWESAQREALLDCARAVIDALAAPQWSDASGVLAGATAPRPQVVVVRVLGPATEPVLQVLRRIRLAWRERAWGLAGAEPRVWST